jgi:hypothetical protein
MNIHVGSGDTWIMTAWVGEDAMAERATCDVAKIGDDWLVTLNLNNGNASTKERNEGWPT